MFIHRSNNIELCLEERDFPTPLSMSSLQRDAKGIQIVSFNNLSKNNHNFYHFPECLLWPRDTVIFTHPKCLQLFPIPRISPKDTQLLGSKSPKSSLLWLLENWDCPLNGSNNAYLSKSEFDRIPPCFSVSYTLLHLARKMVPRCLTNQQHPFFFLTSSNRGWFFSSESSMFNIESYLDNYSP